jgi:hypothetical protein
MLYYKLILQRFIKYFLLMFWLSFFKSLYMSGFPINNVFVDNLNASNTLYVGGSINQNVTEFTNVLPSSPSALEKIYNTTSELFETYYEGTGWVSSTPMPGQIFNLLSGEAPGLYIVGTNGIPELLTSLSPPFQIGGTAYVSTNGNDSTAQLDEPGLPYLTIGAAFIAASANPSIQYSVYVFPGTYTVSTNMCASNIHYVFSPDCIINCTSIPFSNVSGDVSGFSVVGGASFVSTSDSIIDFSDNGGSGHITQNVYFECQSITSGAGEIAVSLQGVSNFTLNASNVSGGGSGIYFNSSTNASTANIHVGTIMGGVINDSTLGTIYLDADYIGITTNNSAIINASIMYANVSNINAPTSVEGALINYGTLYFTGSNLTTNIAFANISGATSLIMNIQNIVQSSTTLSSNSSAPTSLISNTVTCLGTFLTVNSSSTYLKINNASAMVFAIVSSTAGTYLESNVDTLTCGTTAGNIGYQYNAGAGKLTIRGRVSANLPISIVGTITSGSIIIAGILFASGISPTASIVASVASTPIICYGSYTNVGGTNTVTNGLLTTASYVVI